MEDGAEQVEPRGTLCASKSKVRKVFTFGLLCLIILTQNLYFSFPIPFLTHEIVESRKQKTVVGGIVVGVFPLVGVVTSLIAGYLASRTTIKEMMWWSGVAYFLSSIVFIIPMSNDNVFDATVVIARYFCRCKKFAVNAISE